jgi:DnaK suppressor protein
MEEKLDLGEIRARLNTMRQDLKIQIAEEEENARAESANPDRTDLAHSYDFGQRKSALLDQLEEQLEQVEQALGRLEDGTYGKCQNCGQDIAPGRLQAMPQATLCIRCQEELERR